MTVTSVRRGDAASLCRSQQGGWVPAIGSSASGSSRLPDAKSHSEREVRLVRCLLTLFCSDPFPAEACSPGWTMGHIKKNIHFEFSQELVRQPLLYQLNRKFDVVINIRGASVTDEGGFLALELEGDADEIGRVLAFLKDQGVEVAEGLGSSNEA
jgi:hypothetical protein